MRILALEKELPGSSPDRFKRVAEAEARRVWELIQQDWIREVYFRGDHDSAVIMLECEDLQEAEGILNSLPMVEEKLIKFELIPLKPYPGLARLFNSRR